MACTAITNLACALENRVKMAASELGLVATLIEVIKDDRGEARVKVWYNSLIGCLFEINIDNLYFYGLHHCLAGGGEGRVNVVCRALGQKPHYTIRQYTSLTPPHYPIIPLLLFRPVLPCPI